MSAQYLLRCAPLNMHGKTLRDLLNVYSTKTALKYTHFKDSVNYLFLISSVSLRNSYQPSLNETVQSLINVYIVIE